MFELPKAIPDVITLLTLQPEELGAKLLFLLRKRDIQRGHFCPGNLAAELWITQRIPGEQSLYPQDRREAVEIALAEAWSWLEAQGLIVPAPGAEGTRGWKILSRRAQRFESEAEFAQYRAARLLPKEILHRNLADKVWMAFMRAEFDTAVFQAFKAVEIAVRDAAGLPDSMIGIPLMRAAFSPENGPLTNFTVEAGERNARRDLFVGAIGSFKNPHSHKEVTLDDAVEAVESIMFASHLLRIVDDRANAREAEHFKAVTESLGPPPRVAATPENTAPQEPDHS